MGADLPEDAVTAEPSHAASDVGRHLSAPLKDYFTLMPDDALPERLSGLVTRLEALFAGADDALAFDFRADIINALPALRTFAVSLCGDAVRADDLVQEAFARAWANQHRFRPGTNFTAWLFTILRNHFYSECRRQRREVEDVDGTIAGQLTTPAPQEFGSDLQVVLSHMARLPAAQREALLLVGAQGMTYEAAAEVMGCQTGTVKSRVSRARAYLSEHLAIPSAGAST